jgi:hypothetical protein
LSNPSAPFGGLNAGIEGFPFSKEADFLQFTISMRAEHLATCCWDRWPPAIWPATLPQSKRKGFQSLFGLIFLQLLQHDRRKWGQSFELDSLGNPRLVRSKQSQSSFFFVCLSNPRNRDRFQKGPRGDPQLSAVAASCLFTAPGQPIVWMGFEQEQEPNKEKEGFLMRTDNCSALTKTVILTR